MKTTINNTVLKLVEEIKAFDFADLDEGCCEKYFKANGYELVIEIETKTASKLISMADEVHPNEYDVDVEHNFKIQALYNSEDEKVELSDFHLQSIEMVLEENTKQTYSY